MAKLSVSKAIALTPWELITMLKQANIIEDDVCNVYVEMIEKSDVNEGRTIIISWFNTEVDFPKE